MIASDTEPSSSFPRTLQVHLIGFEYLAPLNGYSGLSSLPSKRVDGGSWLTAKSLTRLLQGLKEIMLSEILKASNKSWACTILGELPSGCYSSAPWKGLPCSEGHNPFSKGPGLWPFGSMC